MTNQPNIHYEIQPVQGWVVSTYDEPSILRDFHIVVLLAEPPIPANPPFSCSCQPRVIQDTCPHVQAVKRHKHYA